MGHGIDFGRNIICIRKVTKHLNESLLKRLEASNPERNSAWSSEKSCYASELDGSKLRKHIKKVHKNLSHKTEEQLLKLFQMAGKATTKVSKTIKDVVVFEIGERQNDPSSGSRI